MKKITVLFLVIFAIAKINAQNYLISFAGTGVSTTVDSVKVENLTQGTSLTLLGGDILHLMGAVGINEMAANDETIQVCPNPMQGQAEISFYAKQAGNTQLSIYNISGRKVLQTVDDLSQGVQKYQIVGLKQGMYFINISGETYFYKAKLISLNTTQSETKIKYSGNEKPEVYAANLRSTKSTITMAYTTGDNLSYKGFSCINSTIIYDVPTSTKTVTFTFVAPSLAIGDSYKGGKIAYILQSGDLGYSAACLHGLIAAPSDQSPGTGWGCSGGTMIGGTSIDIGTGQANTTIIVNGCLEPAIAARLCNDLVLNGYSDWYLPSKDELHELFLNQNAIGGFDYNSAYWSSSEASENLAWKEGISGPGFNDKSYPDRVRAVRSF
jgi:hypothetical protein